MTTSFYAPPDAVRDAWLTLPDDEARHAVRVLRKQPGDEIVVVDGCGGWYRVRLEHVDKRNAAGRVVETRHEVGEAPCRLTLGLALLKSQSRFETFLEKAAELGVYRVVPLQTHRTERGGLKQTRAQNILVAAMKQSGRSRLVELAEPQPFEAALAADGLRLLCHEAVDAQDGLLGALRRQPAARDVHVLVGPEGGFTDEEVDRAAASGCQPVSLGPRRLRAETAAITAAAAVMLARESGAYGP